MNHPPGITAGNSGDFDPEHAAAMLEQAKAQSHVQFAPGTPALFAFRAVAVLVACGALWLSVHGQDPYTGPSGWAIAVAVVILAINTGASARVIKRAGDGVSVRAQRARLTWDGVRLAAVVAAYVVIASLYHAGPTYPVWGLYPANAPLLLAVLVAAAAAARHHWLVAGACAAMTIVAVAAGFGGPAGAWLIIGIGVCAVMLATALTARAQRRSGVRPRLTARSTRSSTRPAAPARVGKVRPREHQR
jgi:hypothetical protein